MLLYHLHVVSTVLFITRVEELSDIDAGIVHHYDYYLEMMNLTLLQCLSNSSHYDLLQLHGAYRPHHMSKHPWMIDESEVDLSLHPNIQLLLLMPYSITST